MYLSILLYIDGESWFTSRPHFGPIPVSIDEFDQAQHLIEQYKALQSRIGKDVAQQVWQVFINETHFDESRVLGSFDKRNEKELEILTATSSSSYSNNSKTTKRIATTSTITLEELRKQQSQRPLDWLQQHGTCGDHITVRQSTIPQAGRGAFATRHLPMHTVVAQLPMIHIPDRTVLSMYHFANHAHSKMPPSSDDDAEDDEDDDEMGTVLKPTASAGMMGYQLLLNYCYGHKDSTLVVCPYGPLTNYVNHNQTRANVQLTWGRPETGNHMPALLNQSVTTLQNDKTAKLAMELIAIRDIQPGEELFLDYGNEWDEAWQDHIQNWQPPEGSHRYISAADMNSDDTKQLPTIFEQLNDDSTTLLFPPNLIVKCDDTFPSMNDDNDTNNSKEEWVQAYYNGTIENFLEFHEAHYNECVILRRERRPMKTAGTNHDDVFLYTVHLYREIEREDDDNDDDPYQHSILYNIPRFAIRFFDAPYTDDTFLMNAFRHDIRIPDHLFPTSWKNKLSEE